MLTDIERARVEVRLASARRRSEVAGAKRWGPNRNLLSWNERTTLDTTLAVTATVIARCEALLLEVEA